MHGPSRLFGLAMEIEGGHSYRVRSWMSGATGQFHGDLALPLHMATGKAPRNVTVSAVTLVPRFGETLQEPIPVG
jgi:hypothetical protein